MGGRTLHPPPQHPLSVVQPRELTHSFKNPQALLPPFVFLVLIPYTEPHRLIKQLLPFYKKFLVATSSLKISHG